MVNRQISVVVASQSLKDTSYVLFGLKTVYGKLSVFFFLLSF